MINFFSADISDLLLLLLIIEGFRQGRCATDCVKWGNTFDVPLNSNNVILDCVKPDGRKVCCAALNSTSDNSRGVGWDFDKAGSNDFTKPFRLQRDQKSKCEVKRVYLPSPQEQRDYEMAQNFQSIDDFEKRLDALLKYVVSSASIRNSTAWLNRVQERMQSKSSPKETADDREYLSRFRVTRTCGDDSESAQVWDEWIEPLTITGRFL